MDGLEQVFSYISMIWAPFHEIGHFIFGWLSLNPSFITGWATCGVARIEFFSSFGGGVGEFVGIFLIAELFNRKKAIRKLWPIALFMWFCSFCSIAASVDGDFSGHGDTDLVEVLYRLMATGILIAMIIRRVKLCRRTEKSRPRKSSSREIPSGQASPRSYPSLNSRK